MKNIKLFVLCLSMLFFISGCGKEPLSKTGFKLNTLITITIYDSSDEDILAKCFQICDKYEKIFSRTIEDSELYRLNHRLLKQIPGKKNTYEISEELAEVIKLGLFYSDISKGDLDISIAPISSLWDFTSENPTMPKEKDIKKALKKVNYQDVILSGTEITFKKKGMEIDLGCIAKGFIADRIKEYLLENKVESAVINLGGNVLCIGEKNGRQDFKIGIQKPFANKNETVLILGIKDKSVVSSGSYERYFEDGDKIYHHILNPKDGYPYQNDLLAVSIVSPKSVDGDGLSTVCFALGLEKGMELIDSIEDTYAVFITTDYKLHYSKNFKENIKIY